MTEKEQRTAAKKFVENWTGIGQEDEHCHKFWLELLQNVLGISDAIHCIDFEKKVKLKSGSTKRIDGYISQTRVLIEQKSIDIDLDKPQSGHNGQTPYEQAKFYNDNLNYNEKARWIIVSNFKEIRIHDMDDQLADPISVMLSELPDKITVFGFLVKEKTDRILLEEKISLQAGELVGRLYNALLKQYKNPDDPNSLKSLNMLCVRLVFCLYAEDAGIFGQHMMFHDYLKEFKVSDMRRGLIDLFKVLDTETDKRDPYLEGIISEFPYVNGGLFADENIEIPNFNEEIADIILNKASAGFDWSLISPTIFGAVFESTLDSAKRREGGMHYTSIENIHKVIDPLFLDDLKAELAEIKEYKTHKTIIEKGSAFQEKLASLKFLDPACGSGNFLTETYISLRRLENELIDHLYGEGQTHLDDEDPIMVSIKQFYGIEINDYAVSVAKTALWIAENQMREETEAIINKSISFLPLKSNACIVEANALRIDWESVVPKAELSYIMGNPPFVGKKEQTKNQKNELMDVWSAKTKGVGILDYVTGWYSKAIDYISNTKIHVAFVSTNSITQGEQVPVFWGEMLKRNTNIIFAYRTFKWDSEANMKAHVHCVIIGFCCYQGIKNKVLFSSEHHQTVENINPYLLNAPTVLIANRNKPICNSPQICYGSMPIDDGNLILNKEDVDTLLSENKLNSKFIKKYVGGAELIQGKERWCLWLQGISPKDIKCSKFVINRVNKTATFRKRSNRPQTLALAETPTLFGEIRQPNSNMLVIPKVSSENRKYIPICYVSPDIIVNGSALIVPDAELYHFGVLISHIHMAWMRTVCGRMKSDYQYSGSVVYNNFPWCTPTPEQKAKIEQTAQAILDARALFPDCSLANLYDERLMPPELRRAHNNNDKAVMQAYGFNVKMSESEIVAELMKMYQKMVKE